MTRDDFPSWEDTPEGFQFWIRWIDDADAGLFDGFFWPMRLRR